MAAFFSNPTPLQWQDTPNCLISNVNGPPGAVSPTLLVHPNQVSEDRLFQLSKMWGCPEALVFDSPENTVYLRADWAQAAANSSWTFVPNTATMNRILRTLQHLKSLKLNASWDAVVPTRQKHSYVFVPFALGDTIIVRRLPAPAAPNAPVGPHVNQVMQPAIVGQQMNQYLPHSVNQLLNQPFGQLINQPLVGQLMNQQQLLGQPPVQIPAHIYGGYALVPQLQQPCRIQGPHAHAAHPPPPRAYYPPYADLPPLQHTCHPYFVIYAAVRHFEQRQDLTDAQLQVYSGLRAVVALWDDLKEFPVDVMYGQPFWAPFKGNNRPPLVRDSPGADEEDEEGGRAAQQWENGGSGSNVALKRAPGGDDESSERRTRRKIDAHKVKLEEAQRGLDDDYSEDLAGAYGTGSG